MLIVVADRRHCPSSSIAKPQSRTYPDMETEVACGRFLDALLDRKLGLSYGREIQFQAQSGWPVRRH